MPVRVRLPLLKHLDQHMREVVSGAEFGFLFNVLLARSVGADGTGIYHLALTVITPATVAGRMGLDNATNASPCGVRSG